MLSKEKKIKLILDIKTGVIPINARPVFSVMRFFLVSMNDRSINDVFLNESDFNETLDYIKKNKIGTILETPEFWPIDDFLKKLFK